MVKIIYQGTNNKDIVELFYDTERKKYILIINNIKRII